LTKATSHCHIRSSDFCIKKFFAIDFIAFIQTGTLFASILRKTGSSRGLVVGAPGQACRFGLTLSNP
jgi:hypothetical protein